MRKCSCCHCQKIESEFPRSKVTRNDGFSYYCRDCIYVKSAARYLVKKTAKKCVQCKCSLPLDYIQINCAECRIQKSIADKRDYEQDKQRHICVHCDKPAAEGQTRCLDCAQKYNLKSKIRKSEPGSKLSINKQKRERYRTDIDYRLTILCRGLLRHALSETGFSKAGHTWDILGCTKEELHVWLETQFQPGMTWENQGAEWHIDHITPIRAFHPLTPINQKKAFNYTNLKPLWAEDNWRKSDLLPDGSRARNRKSKKHYSKPLVVTHHK